MSRIGKAPIELASGVTIDVKDNVVTVKGKHGELSQSVDSRIAVEVEGTTVNVIRSNDEKESRALHGLYRALINNMVVGVTEGYTIQQELVGVGYRASVKGDLLELALGYSHPIVMQIPKEVKVTADTVKGQPPLVTLFSHDKQLVGQVAAKIRSFRKPEPYKGKGIKFKGELLRRKAGKTASK